MNPLVLAKQITQSLSYDLETSLAEALRVAATQEREACALMVEGLAAADPHLHPLVRRIRERGSP